MFYCSYKSDMHILKENKIVIFIFFFSLLLRLYVRSMELCISRDGCYYILLANIWIKSGIQAVLEAYPVGCPPLFLFLMAIMHYLSIPPEISGIVLNILAGSILPCQIYAISREIFPRKKKLAVFSAVLAAVNPSMVFLSIEPQRDMIYLFFCGCVFLSVLKALQKNNLFLWFISGCASALASLTRFEAFELLPIFFIILIFCAANKRFSPQKTILAGCILGCGVLLVNIVFFCFVGSFNLVFVYYKNFMLWRWNALSTDLMQIDVL